MSWSFLVKGDGFSLQHGGHLFISTLGVKVIVDRRRVNLMHQLITADQGSQKA